MARGDGVEWASGERLRTVLGLLGDETSAPRPFEQLDVFSIDARPAAATKMRYRGLAIVGLLAASSLVAGVVLMWAGHQSVQTSDPLPGTEPLAAATWPSNAPGATPAAPTSLAVPVTTAVPPPDPLAVLPVGLAGPDAWVQGIELNIQSGAATGLAGDVVLRYDLQVVGDVDLEASTGRIVVPPLSEDGQLAFAVDCPIGTDCLSVVASAGGVGATIPVVIRRTAVPLTEGQHDGRFRFSFDNGSSVEFSVLVLASPLPSADFSEQVKASVGAPTKVQTVAGLGRFGYHSVAAFDSIWVLGRLSGSVARIDAITGALVATIDVGGPGAGGLNRLAASDDSIYVSGKVIRRIDPTDNTVTELYGPHTLAYAAVAAGRTVWVGGFGGIERIEPDGTFTRLDLPDAPWMDLTISNGLVWAMSQARGEGRLIAFDGFTGEVRFDLPIAHDVAGFAVRLVADDRSVVVGVDTSGGGGRTGELLVIDPLSGTITDAVPLPHRPEGIVLTTSHIWTSGAVLDRRTLAVTQVGLGFWVTRGPDGSIWTGSGGTVAVRYAPGDYAG